MTTLAATLRNVLRALPVAAAAALLPVAPAWGTVPEGNNFDARTAGASPPELGVERARERMRERLGPFAALSVDPRTDTLRSIGRLDGFLTGPKDGDEAAIALDYVDDHAAAFGIDGDDLAGLRLTHRSVVGDVEYLSWEQRYRGIPAADAGLKAAVTSAGRLLSVTGPPAPDLHVRSADPPIGAGAAYAAARQSAGTTTGRPSISTASSRGERETLFADGGRASLALYRSGTGYRLAWRVLAPVSSSEVYDSLVDASTGTAVRRSNLVKAANAWVFEYSPAERAQKTNQNFTPWLTSGTALSGPNVHAFSDIHDVVPIRPGSHTYDLTPEPGSDVGPTAGGNFDFPLHAVPAYDGDGCPGTSQVFPTSACTWDPRTATGPNAYAVNRAQSATQLFYLVNVFHDHLRDDPNIAFTSGGFETTAEPLGDLNAPAGPTRSDPVLAQTLDGAATGVDGQAGLPDARHINNSNFLALPDGYPGLLQMYLWKPPFGGYDSSNDASMVFHEYTHGLSNRLVTDAAGYGALNTAQAGAMGEGLSDFYAMDYLEARQLETDDVGVADVRLGRYLDNGTGTLVRFQPIDCMVTSPAGECSAGTGSAGPGGFTYADFGHVDPRGPEVHGDGEIWAQTLWDLRRALVGRYGRDENDPENGIARTRRYVTQAMRLSPPEPSFLDMRNAMLEASADEDDGLIWQVFANRGMGYLASTDGSADEAPVADGTIPPPPSVATGAVVGVGPGSATLTATVTPHGGPTQVLFEYGPSTSYGMTVSAGRLEWSTSALPVSATVSGLQPATTYHFRAVAVRAGQRYEGGDATFTTSAAPPAQPFPQPPVAKLAALASTKLTANRKGFFKVKVTFGDAAPLGTARLTVLRKGKRLARATTAVRRGLTVAKTLRLSRKGRRVIRAGQTKRVTLELRLPGGEKVKKRLKLTRKKR